MALYLRLVRAAEELADAVDAISFGAPVTHVYNPLRYAAAAHREYLRRYANGTPVCAMPKGPGFMPSSTMRFLPFGEVRLVRDWLGIETEVGKPAREHPKRPIEGFACARSEVSGARLWGALSERYGDPNRFFAERFIANYCPLVFMEASGKNRTPDKLPPREREPLYAACDAHLGALVRALEPEWVIGVGKFAEERAQSALAGSRVQIGTILHPSPASPLANRGWADQADQQLMQLGLRL